MKEIKMEENEALLSQASPVTEVAETGLLQGEEELARVLLEQLAQSSLASS